MIDDWKTYYLGEIGEIIGGGTPSTKVDVYYGGHISWITPRDLSGYSFRYIETGDRNISEEGLKNSSARMLPKGTVLFTSRAPIGYVAIAEKDLCTNQGFKSIICNEKAHNEFIYYWLKLNKEVIEGYASGSTFKEISGGVLKNIKILLPPVDEQISIAKILSDLDSKIELLQKQNETLEKIGQEIFKQWFVDFEFPNAEGKPYKSSGGRMVESELGEIPQGWGTTKIIDLDVEVTDFIANGSFASLKKGVSGIKDKEDYALFLRNVDLKSNLKSKRFVDKNSYEFLKKSKLFGGEVIISNVADVGSVYLCPKLDKPMTLGNNQILIRNIKEIKYTNYLFLYFKYFQGKQSIKNITTGSAQLKFNKTDFRNLDLVIPKNNKLHDFDKIFESLWDKLTINIFSIDLLEKSRDSLLPKLMTGKIRVPVEDRE